MKILKILCIAFLIFILLNCNSDKSKKNSVSEIKTHKEISTDTLIKHFKFFKAELPTIGLLMYNGLLQTEVTATSDVFSKPTEDGTQLFNVVTIAETENLITTEEGLKFVPDFSFENCPKLEALFVPSAYNMHAQVHNKHIIDFIKKKNLETKYVVSNCGGAQLIGASGIADGKKIVTWIGGGEQLQKDYPNLIVQNDSLVTYVEDGKFSSSNGNLASYSSALNLVEKLSNKEHRKFVESYLYVDRRQNWK